MLDSSAFTDGAAQRQQTPWRVLILLMAVTGIGSMCLNIMAPAVPGLADQLHTDPANVQLTISLFLVGIAISQLLLGPLSDRIGRRPVLLGGLALVAGASLVAIFVTTIEGLVAARVVQAFGAATGIVVGRAIIRDLVDRERTASLIGLVTTVMVVSPMIAPVLGGTLDTLFGWQSIFIFLAGLGTLFLIWGTTVLHETLPPGSGGGLGSFIADLRALMSSGPFIGYVMAGALATAPFYVYLGGAPHIVVNMLHRSSAEYGLWFMCPSIGYMFGNFACSRLVVRHGSIKVIRWGLMCLIAGSAIVCVGVFSLPHEHLWLLGSLFVPQLLMSFGNGLFLPNSIAGAVSVRPQAAGAAAGIVGFTQMGLGAIISQTSNGVIVHAATAMPLALQSLAYTVAAALPLFALVFPRQQAGSQI